MSFVCSGAPVSILSIGKCEKSYLTFLVSFRDEEVLSPDFKDKLMNVATVMQPFVHWYVYSWLSIFIPSSHTRIFPSLNDMMTIQDGDDDNSEDGSEIDDE